jgi:cell division transport system permease protein
MKTQWILLTRAFKESFKNLWRNLSLTVATITVITIITLIFNILFTINLSAKTSLEELGKKVDMIVYLKDNLEYNTIKSMIEDIEKVDGVEEVKYTSKKDAITQISEKYPNIKEFFEKYEVENPLPESLTIKTSHPSNQKEVSDFLSESRHQSMLRTDTETDEPNLLSGVTLALQEVTNITEKILYFVLAALLIGSTLIVSNAIKLTIYARKKEIGIMKLVGASRFSIKAPFILEGIWYFAIAILINGLIWDLAVNPFALATETGKPAILLIELGIGVLIAITSSTLASVKHLNA